jgi:hypothetical protein
LALAAGHYLVAPQLLLQPGEDPFSLLKQEKKDRQKKQNKQQLANVKQAIKTGGAAAVPATLRLAATLPDKGKGKPTKRRELRDEVSQLVQFTGSRAKDDCDYSSAICWRIQFWPTWIHCQQSRRSVVVYSSASVG